MSELDDIRKRTEGHTPGPLELVSYNLETDDHIDIARYPVKYSEGKIIAKWLASVENGSGYLTEEDHSNAKLFAAAPDLLRIATEQEAELTTLRTERDKLQEALYAGYMIHHGRAHIRSRSDIPMAIGDERRERIIRAAIRPQATGGKV